MVSAAPMMDPGREGVEPFRRHPRLSLRVSLLRDRLHPLLPCQGAASPQRGLDDARDYIMVVAAHTPRPRVRLAAAKESTARLGNLWVVTVVG